MGINQSFDQLGQKFRAKQPAPLRQSTPAEPTRCYLADGTGTTPVIRDKTPAAAPPAVSHSRGVVRPTAPPPPESFRVHITGYYRLGEQIVEAQVESVNERSMFLRGARGLHREDIIDLVLDLPGVGECEVAMRVTQTSEPGAMLQFMCVRELPEKLWDYLFMLSSRNDFVVLVRDQRWRDILSDATFAVLPAPEPHLIRAAVAGSERRVVGLLVPQLERDAYLRALPPEMRTLVVCADAVHEIGKVIAACDENSLVQGMFE